MIALILPFFFIFFLVQVVSHRSEFKNALEPSQDRLIRYFYSPYGLLATAIVFSVVINVLTSLDKHENRITVLALIFAALFSTMLMVVSQKKFPYSDPAIVPTSVFLSGLGIAMQRRLFFLTGDTTADSDQSAAGGNLQSGVEAVAQEGTPSLLKTAFAQVTTPLNPGQLAMLIGGVFFAFVVLFGLRLIFTKRTNSPYYHPNVTLIIVAAVFLLTLLISRPANPKSSVVLSIFGKFQLVDFLKFLSVMATAAFLSRFGHLIVDSRSKDHILRRPRGFYFGSFVAYYFVVLGVLLYVKDLGTLLLISMVTMILFFLAVRETLWLLITSGMGIAAVVMAYFLQAHFRGRVKVWLDPYDIEANSGTLGDPSQFLAAKVATLSGGLTGTGIGENTLLNRVPLVFSDMVPAAFSAEFGLIGAVSIFLCFSVLSWRMGKIALQGRESFEAFYLLGLALLLFAQVTLIYGGVYGFLPLTGQVTPFLARGGAALIAFWGLSGLFIFLSDRAQNPLI